MEQKKYQNYAELRAGQQKVHDDFTNRYCFFAFDNAQFDEGMEKLGLKPSDTGKICRFYPGAYILREHTKEYHKLMNELDAEAKEHMRDYDFAKDAFMYEMGNHEYCLTHDIEEVLEALNLTTEDIDDNIILYTALVAAKRQYFATCNC